MSLGPNYPSHSPQRHCMIDIESLGVVPGSIVLSIGAVMFNPYEEGAVGATFYGVIDTVDS